jgi:hypothetical protein
VKGGQSSSSSTRETREGVLAKNPLHTNSQFLIAESNKTYMESNRTSRQREGGLQFAYTLAIYNEHYMSHTEQRDILFRNNTTANHHVHADIIRACITFLQVPDRLLQTEPRLIVGKWHWGGLIPRGKLTGGVRSSPSLPSCSCLILLSIQSRQSSPWPWILPTVNIAYWIGMKMMSTDGSQVLVFRSMKLRSKVLLVSSPKVQTLNYTPYIRAQYIR